MIDVLGVIAFFAVPPALTMLAIRRASRRTYSETPTE